MKMTKQPKEEKLFLQKAVRILHKYWGKEGKKRFIKILAYLEDELQPLRGKTVHEVQEYVSTSFTAWGWDNDEIKVWFDGKSSGQKTPFWKNSQLGENEAAVVLFGDFLLTKLAITLKNSGMSYEEISHLVSATVIAIRLEMEGEISSLLDGIFR